MQDLLADGDSLRAQIRRTFHRTTYAIWSDSFQLLRKTKRGFINLGRKSPQASLRDMRYVQGEAGTFSWQMQKKCMNITHEHHAPEVHVKRIIAKEVILNSFSMRKWNDKVGRKRFRSSHIGLDSATRKDERTQQWSSRRGPEEWFLEYLWKLLSVDITSRKDNIPCVLQESSLPVPLGYDDPGPWTGVTQSTSRIFVVLGEINEKTRNVQAWILIYSARNIDEITKNAGRKLESHLESAMQVAA